MNRLLLALLLLVLTGPSRLLLAQDPDLARLRAQLAAGDATGVVDHVRRSIGARTVTVEALLLGTEAAITAARFVDARGMSDLAVATAPADPRTHMLAGHALYAMAEEAGSRARGGGSFIRATYADAASAYAAARKCGGEAFDLAWWEADSRFRAEEFEPALLALEVADLTRPGSAQVERLRGEVLLASNKAESALPGLARARQLHPADEAIALISLRAALATRNRDAALAVMLECLPHIPESPALFRAFIGAFEAERPDTFLVQALGRMRGAVPNGREAVFVWFAAAVDEAGSRNSAALAGFDAYLALRPGAPEGEFKRGSVLIALGRLPEARGALLKAHAAGTLDEGSVVAALRGLAGAHVARREFADAVAVQELALAISRDDMDTLNLGVLQLQAGKRDEALATYRALVAREDLDLAAHARAWNYLGLALQGQGDFTAAEAAFRESLRTLESALDARENLAALLLRRGSNVDSAREAALVLQEDPSRPRSLYLCLAARHPWLPKSSR